MKTLSPTASEHDVEVAISTILSDKEKYNTSLNYAVNYCRAAQGMTGEMLRVQCLYILGNISSWRHPQAKTVRSILKSYAGVK